MLELLQFVVQMGRLAIAKGIFDVIGILVDLDEVHAVEVDLDGVRRFFQHLNELFDAVVEVFWQIASRLTSEFAYSLNIVFASQRRLPVHKRRHVVDFSAEYVPNERWICLKR